MVVLFDRKRRGPVILYSIPQPMQRADSRVATPGKDKLRSASRSDQLIVDQVRSHPNQREIATSLADNLVTGGKGNEVRKSFERDDVSVAHHFLNRFL